MRNYHPTRLSANIFLYLLDVLTSSPAEQRYSGYVHVQELFCFILDISEAKMKGPIVKRV